MLLRVRVALADRPGSLGRVTTALGWVGADVVQVTVLARESGRAWDDLTVTWPSRQPVERLGGALETLPGVNVEGIWHTIEAPDCFPDLDLLEQVAARPARGTETLVDGLPKVFSATWAAAVSHDGTRVHASPSAPADPGGVGVDVTGAARAAATTIDGRHYAVVPVDEGALRFVVCRDGGAPLHRVELDRLARLVRVLRGLAAAAPALTR